MKLALLFGFIGGFGGVLACAHYLPWWGEHERVPSRTSVQANGGRLEQFVIRLPADRIDGTGAYAFGALSAPAHLPAPLSEQPLVMEHFKVRDVDDRVIGIAVRHRTAVGGNAASAWWIVLPGRGALLLNGGERPDALNDALAAAGWRQGSAWSGEVEVAPGAEGSGTVMLGSREFAGLEGRYTERWQVTGVSDGGELQGTVQLVTTTHGGA